jgi:diguanylate cyclase (GGDEF)-like protein
MNAIMTHPPRTGGRLAVIYCDIDAFKAVNDRYGHGVGDQVLIEVSRRIEATLREGDTVGRLGGDEFLILLPQVRDLDDALLVAEKIRTTGAEPISVGGHRITPTLSLGVALVEPHDTIDGVVARADKALYAAKERGRNRVVADSLVT